MTGPRRLLSISSGSMEASVHGRNAMARLLATRALGFFDEVDHVFFPAGVRSMQELEPGFRVHEIPGREDLHRAPTLRARRRGLHDGWREIVALAAGRRPSVVNATEPFISGVLGRLVARRMGRPLVITLVSNYRLSWEVGRLNPIPFLPPWATFRVEEWVYAHAHRIHTDCVHYGAYAVSRGALAERVRVLPRYVDPFFYEGTPDPAIWSRLGVPGPAPLVYVGRLSPEKYALELADTFLRVAAVDPERRLAVVGGGGPHHDAFFRRLEDGGVADRAVLLEGISRPDMLSVMGEAGAVLATHAGYALLEAALAGAKVVAYDYEWHPELIHDGVTGRLVPYRDSTAMATAVLELLADRVKADSMARTLRARAQEGFRPDRHLSLLRESYRELLGAWDGPRGGV